jgi:hypothetical protein
VPNPGSKEATIGCLVIIIIAGFAIAFEKPKDAPKQREINVYELGDAWPLDVTSGTLTCYQGTNDVTFRFAGKEYAVNGSAAAREDAYPIDPIWRDGPHNNGSKMPMSPLIEAGLALCKN